MAWRGIEYRTEVVKNCFDADWHAAFNLDLDDCAKGNTSDCDVSLWDWDVASKDDLIGGFKISAARMSELFRSKLGSGAEHGFAVVREGRPVVGHDRQKTLMALTVRVCAAPVAFPTVVALHGGDAERRVELTVASVQHLPSMDGIMGKCDPYCVVSFEGQDYRTETKKNCYEAEYDEVFNLDIPSSAKGTRSSMKVTVWDWDATSKDDEVGFFTLSAERMSEIFRGALGASGQETFAVLADGKPVVGHDKQPCEITLRVRVCAVPRLFGTIRLDPEAKGPRRIQLTVVGANNLPKMDVLTGTVDPYVRVKHGTRPDLTTRTIKSAYAPEWEETFVIEHADVSTAGMRTSGDAADEGLRLSVWDWDVATQHDLIGETVITGQEMANLWLAEEGWETTETVQPPSPRTCLPRVARVEVTSALLTGVEVTSALLTARSGDHHEQGQERHRTQQNVLGTHLPGAGKRRCASGGNARPFCRGRQPSLDESAW